MWSVSKEFHFDAAHSLPHLPESHKCSRLHGHTYKVVPHFRGDLSDSKCWVVDYADISAAMKPLLERLDHRNLNDVIMATTTAENVAAWFYMELCKTALKPLLWRVDVHETTGTCCTYEPR